MPSTYYKPVRSSSWADDEDDEWDFDSYIANLPEDHMKCPSVEEMGPLTRDDREDVQLKSLPKFISDYVNEAAPQAAPPLSPVEKSKNFHLPGDRSIYYSPDPNTWPVPQPTVHWRRMQDNERSGKPAYPELSVYDGFVYPFERCNYAANWRAAKMKKGLGNLNEMMMLRGSRLREEFKIEDEEPPELVEDSSEGGSEDELATPTGSPEPCQTDDDGGADIIDPAEQHVRLHKCKNRVDNEGLCRRLKARYLLHLRQKDPERQSTLGIMREVTDTLATSLLHGFKIR